MEFLKETDKPQLNITLLGQKGHGKSSLTRALSSVMEKTGIAEKPIEIPPSQRECGSSIPDYKRSFETQERIYLHQDFPAHAQYIQMIFDPKMPMEGAILVVAADEGPKLETIAQVRFAQRLDLSPIIVFINKVDLVEDTDQVETVVKEVRQLLQEHGFSSETIPFVRGSAIGALNEEQQWEEKIIELADTVDKYFSEPIPATEKPFLMAVDGVFPEIKEYPIVTGKIIRGQIHTGDQIEFIGDREDNIQATVVHLELFRKLRNFAEAGDNVAVFLDKVDPKAINSDLVMVKPGTMNVHSKFKALVYVVKNNWVNEPLINNALLGFSIHQTKLIAEVVLAEGVPSIQPGATATIEVELASPFPIEKGLGISVRKAGSPHVLGKIMEILN